LLRADGAVLPFQQLDGALSSVLHRHVEMRELNADIRQWIEHRNQNPKPYVWTKTAEQILETLAAYCQRITDSRH
jgi:hypothetical protein